MHIFFEVIELPKRMVQAPIYQISILIYSMDYTECT